MTVTDKRRTVKAEFEQTLDKIQLLHKLRSGKEIKIPSNVIEVFSYMAPDLRKAFATPAVG